jgi:DDE superfamily endonuclease
MASLRFTEVQARPTEFLDFTSLPLEEFQTLVPPFEAAFQAHMAAWRLDGKPRTARRFMVYKNCPLPTPQDRLFFHSGLPENLCPPGGARAPVWHGPEQSESMDSHAPSCPPRGAPHPGRCPGALLDGPGAAARRLRGGRGIRYRTPGGGAGFPHHSAGVPPFAHDGTERRIVRPQDPPAQTQCYSGKKKDHTVKNVLLVNALLLILFLSDTYGGRTHDKPIADASP